MASKYGFCSGKAALTRSSKQGVTPQFATFLLPQNTLHKQGCVYQYVSLLEHVLKAELLRVKTCSFRHRHNIGHASASAFQGHQSSLGTWLPIHTALEALPASQKRSVCGHWVKQQTLNTQEWDVLSHHYQLKSLSNPTTLPIPAPGTAQGVSGHTGPDKRCPPVEYRKNVELTGQVSSCPSLECSPGSSNQTWDSSAGGCIQSHIS